MSVIGRSWVIACLVPVLLAAVTGTNADPKPLVKSWLESGPPEKCVDILFVGDGYTAKDLTTQAGKFWKDVGRYSTRLFKDEPFLSYKAKFNVRAAFVVSADRGCDGALGHDEFDTALDSSFDTKEGRLLVFQNAKRLKQVVEDAGGADLVFVMVNTERYGGAGTVLNEIKVRGRPCPAPTFSAQDTASFLIAVHELGHSFADLADEYVDVPLQPTFKMPDKGDLDSPNVTLPRCFDATSRAKLAQTLKWAHFLALPEANKHDWLEEGGYYREKGVFRPWKTCRMQRHDDAFCPVCCEEVAQAIFVACGDTWDDALWHKQHPLSQWH